MHCYVYFKSLVKHEEQVQSCFAKLSQSIANMGFSVQFQRRPETKDGLQTWMEIYSNVPDHFDQMIAAVVSESGLQAFVVGARHHEYFIEVQVT